MNKSNLIFVINCVLVLYLLSGCVSSQAPALPNGESPEVTPSPTMAVEPLRQ